MFCFAEFTRFGWRVEVVGAAQGVVVAEVEAELGACEGDD
jgi:hypothetical protein